MPNQLRKTLKSFFRRGAKPTESQFAKWIDACLLLGEDGISKDGSGLEISKNLVVKGNLIVDGTFWLSDGALPESNDVMNPNLGQTPKGAVFLWFGETLPYGYEFCDGKNGRPYLAPPECTSNGLNYIIKVIG
ncbi:hypothetical protein [Pseudoalteromonas luteoviolacea]|uniref:Uncharacterized protein n=1 Tax=Pseudoalteromonas luteoviolacea DSM 6061 TaxID=1365250 RepID=A0A166VAZ4_9GAMM|nr:hypothetical protein [Pseudoalteromonas luteoviolacea]KZN32436.1 hypothetical protein N475_22405 [Pseudoalteromonas luteoviolacea DSM 6061]KZN56666.1 hypothetical protein N474_10970 [Pseudoalteromonas luteoviolacea CPMOR-2]MBE0386051.1 hypothetical protein [Pseudoalteromonas luteoviolacea DSM 6061]TQF70966.1 hypothetical protein FLM44_07725 [Pseudoalteromonas luteoviolacea]